MLDFTRFLSIPIRLAKIELTFTQTVEFKHFFHGNVIRALLINLLKQNERSGDHGLSPGIVPVVLESGHLTYKAGDTYTFGLVFIGNDLNLSEKFEERLVSQISGPKGIIRLGLNAQLNKYTLFKDINLLNIFTKIKKNRTDPFIIRLLTPIAIDREKGDILRGHSRYDQQLFRIDVFLKKIIDRYNNLCRNNILLSDEIDRDSLPQISLTLLNSKLVWLELPTKKRKNNYGGVIGQLAVGGLSDDFWLMALLAGSFLHIGEKINFGFGFYDFPDFFHDISQLMKPQQGFLEKIVEQNNLLNAFQETKNSSKMIGADEISVEDVEEQYGFWQEQLREKLLNAQYRPAPLKGVVTKNDNKIRALAVPSFIDRWLQRATLNVLGPVLDTLLEDCSYAYRRNYSRQRAMAAIKQAYDEGYRYVLEADIENFFDEVDWQILISKLKALFPFDPIVELIEKWVKAPVMFKNKLIERKQGLPQGAVISPVLSNFYLDEFDETIRNAGFRLIRFADDFVILCKSKKQAEHALENARQALETLDLELKDSKTKITNFDEGFRYLGYLFCRSVVLETIKKKENQKFDWALFDESKIPPNSWLANAKFNGLTIDEFVKSKRQRLFKTLFDKTNVSVGGPLKKSVYLGEYRSKVKIKNNQLVILKDDGEKLTVIDKIPLERIGQVILLGPIPLTMPALFKLVRRKIPILFTSPQGKPLGLVQTFNFDTSLWIKQKTKFEDPVFKVNFCRAIVLAKIHNYMKNLQYLNWPQKEESMEKLSSLKNICLNKNSVESIRGIEGRAAAVFYQSFADIIGPQWNFKHRRKNPPPDGINALLSLGFTILYNYLSVMIIGQGLNAQQGIYHVSQAGFNALSSDLQEEFRFIIDRLVLTLIHRNQLTLNQFKQPEKRGHYFLLDKSVKKLFIQQLEKKLKQKVFWRVCQKEMSYMEIMEYQVFQLKEIVLNKKVEYEAFLRR